MTRAYRQLAWNSPAFYAALIGIAVLLGLALARLSLLSAFLLTVTILLGIGTLIEPVVGLVTTLFVGILKAWLGAEFPAIPALIAMPLLAVTLASWLMRGASRRAIRLHTGSTLVPLAVFIGAAALSLVGGVELQSYGLPELLKWLQILALFWMVADHIDARRAAWLAGGLLAIGVFQAGMGLWQFGLRGTGPDHFSILGGRFYRAYGTFEQPNPYAGYLGLVFALGLGMLAVFLVRSLEMRGSDTRNEPKDYRIAGLLLLSSGVVGAALVASWSRGAWLGMAAAILVTIAALPRRAWLSLGLVALVVVVTLGLDVTGLMPASVSARLTGFTQYTQIEDVRGVSVNPANYAVVERLAHWQAALGMWRANLWGGVGFGDYEPAYPDYRLMNWPVALGHAHNYYLNIGAETGIIGLAAYLLFWGAVFWQTWRLTRTASLRGWQRGLAIGLLGAWTHLSVHHLFDNLYVNNVHLHIGVMLGLVAVLSEEARRANGSD